MFRIDYTCVLKHISHSLNPKKFFYHRYGVLHQNRFLYLNQLLRFMFLASGFDTMQTSSEDNSVAHINQLLGYDERRNDILYVAELEDCQSNNVVVYFGGDIQDFRENMKNNPENKNYMQWSLENVAVLLHQKFPCSHVIVVRPSRYDRGTYSCYDNFVPSKKYGIPSFLDYNNSLRHLEHLLRNLAIWINNNDPTLENEHKYEYSANNVKVKRKFRQQSVNFDESRITLIGFSKGCVVLNQFIHEFYFLLNKKTSSEKCDLAAHISDIYFLDGGHAGGKNTWVTDGRLLQTFSNLGINVHIHVTPYQVKDKTRPWIGKEEAIFNKTLREHKVNVFRKLHFENEPSSLNKHFEILNSFL